MLKLLRVLFQMFFRLFFTVEYYGVENIPQSGPAVLAGNHPSYLDPVLIYAAANRPVHFLAWDRLFKIPLLGYVIRTFGAIPVDLSKKDSNAFDQAMKVLQSEKLLALFPEGHRSERGVIETLKSGAARLAIFNKCPLVPITITGAYEAWPVTRLFPRLRKITVKFHEPIVPDPIECEQRRDDHEFFDQITETWRERVNQRLLPGLKAQEALNKHFSRPASYLRIFEAVPAGALLIMLFSAAPRFWLTLPVLIYYSYLLLDIWLLPPGRLTKVVRDLATPALILAWNPILLSGVGLRPVGFLSLVILTAGLLLPYYWTNYYDSQRFLRGLVLTYYLSIMLEIFDKTRWAYGPHWAIPFFALLYSIYYRPLFWYCQVAVVLFYSGLLFWLTRGEFTAPELSAYLLLPVLVNIHMIAFKFTAHDGRVV